MSEGSASIFNDEDNVPTNDIADIAQNIVQAVSNAEQPTYRPLASDRPPRISIDLLIKSLTPFNGERQELSNFLINCNNAFYMAQPDQEQTLTFFIFTKLSASVKTAINISQIHSWTELRAALKRTYGTLENTTQLLQELDSASQKHTESVKEYFLRLERLKVKCLKNIADENEDPLELCGKLAMINQTALRRFCLFSSEEISRVLRQKENLRDMNQAYHYAIIEEQVLSLKKLTISHNRGHNPTSQQYRCKICRRNNHDAKNCRFKNSSNEPMERRPTFTHNNNFNTKKCDYCKRIGHTEPECRTKTYHEQRNKQLHPDPRIGVTLNYQQAKVTDAPSSVMDKLAAFTQEQMF